MPLFHISWLTQSNKIDASVKTGEILRKALALSSTSNFTNLKISAKMLKIPNVIKLLCVLSGVAIWRYVVKDIGAGGSMYFHTDSSRTNVINYLLP